MGKVYFPRVKEAREALKERALEIFESYLAVIEEARSAGDYETASNALQWLMSHMPEETGERMIDISIDKPKEIESKVGPTIQIGFALGGMDSKKAIGPHVIDTPPVLLTDKRSKK